MKSSSTKRKAKSGGSQKASSQRAARRRSNARLAAVQALYQIEMTGVSVEQAVKEFLEVRLKEDIDGMDLAEADRGLMSDVVRGAAARQGELDDMLSAVLDPDWPVERLEILLRALLRAGVYELSERRTVPVAVTISEYLSVADAFFSGREPAMVNGVLERVARALRPEECKPDPADVA